MADPDFSNALTYIEVLVETAPNTDTYSKPCGLDGRSFTRSNAPFETQFAACTVGQAGKRVRVSGLDDWTISGDGVMTTDAYDVLDEWMSGAEANRGPRKIIVLAYTGDSNSLTVHRHYILTGLLNSLGHQQGANNELTRASIEIQAADGTVTMVDGAFAGTIVNDA